MRFLSVSECICRIDQRAEILKRHICLNFLRRSCDKAAVFAEICGDGAGFCGNLVGCTVGKRLLCADAAPEGDLVAVFVLEFVNIHTFRLNGIEGIHAHCGKIGQDPADVPAGVNPDINSGGMEQISSKISFNEIDVVFYLRSTDPAKEIHDYENTLLRLCDVYNVPLATNIASAEVLVTAIDNGSLNWREFINPRSEYNMQRKRKV